MADQGRTALVLGATGALGGAVTAALLAQGWRVRALARDADSAKSRAPDSRIEWIVGDAMQAGDVARAVAGADILFHGVNPPGYRNWRGLAIPMLANSIAAARAADARLIFPGNVYNFGPDAWPVLRENSPQNPLTRKGRVRVEMEAALQTASTKDLRVTIVRAGDFFGPGYGESWLGQIILKGGRKAKAIVWPGRRDAGHAFAYLPDLARTIVQLAERDKQTPAFARYHFGGQWVASAEDFASAVCRATGRPNLRLKNFSWAPVYLAAPFVTLMRELLEMRYLWNEPVRLDNAALTAELGAEPHTPLEEALAATIA